VHRIITGQNRFALAAGPGGPARRPKYLRSRLSRLPVNRTETWA
jgi:hypothetical protein